MKPRFTTFATAAALLTIIAPTFSACSGADEHEAIGVGTVTAALSAVASDGATYSFPSGDWQLRLKRGGSVVTTIPLTGDSPSASVGAGAWEVELHSDIGTIMYREKDGVVSGVSDVVWIDPQPMMIEVIAGEVTPIVLHMRIGEVGDVTFDPGRVLVELDAERGTGTLRRMEVVSVYTVEGANVEAGLESLLAPVPRSMWVEFNVDVDGPWSLGATANGASVAQVPVTLRTAVADDPNTEAGFQAFRGDSGYASVTDGGPGQPDLFSMVVEHDGRVRQSMRDLLPERYTGAVRLTAELAENVFDGTTLSQAGPWAMLGGNGTTRTDLYRPAPGGGGVIPVISHYGSASSGVIKLFAGTLQQEFPGDLDQGGVATGTD
jgi:hypothetical protein